LWLQAAELVAVVAIQQPAAQAAVQVDTDHL
jgi:hypothetical protein